MGGFCSQRISFPVWSLNNTCSTSFLSSVTHSHCFLMSFLKSIQIKESPKHKDKHTLKQVAPSSPGTPFLIFSIFTHVRKSWQQLRWRWDVWRWGDTFEPISLYGLQRGAYTGRRVMYYLGLDLPRRLIRAWLREAVTGCFSPSAQEWKRTRGHHIDPDQYSHTLNLKHWKVISLCCHVRWWCLAGLFRRH